VRALEWEEKNRLVSYLLRGEDLTEAEQWLMESHNKQPIPTDSHIQYITTSRKVELENEQKAQQQFLKAELSQANSLGRYALSLFNEHKELEAFVEAIRAGKILQKHSTTDPVVVSALQQVIYQGNERNRLEGHNGDVNSISFSPDGQTL